jgi:8-oxo-dGTP pyrophosphatase MutT (NUDIX family)
MMAAPAPALPAATLVLARDGADGLEVLMLKRHENTVFSGALVFPGGRLDPEDAADTPIARCRPVPGVDRAAMGYRVAAIRECYEEAHLLLARAAGEAELLTAAALAALEAETGRQLGRPAHFRDLLAGGRIELATDALVPFGRWVTPERSPKRYDTMFFLARAPEGQVVRPDGHEAVAAAWLTPAAFLVEADAARERLVFATRMNLVRLAKSRDAAAALAAAAATADFIVPLSPEIYRGPEGLRIRIPPGRGRAMGFDDCDMPTSERPNQ